MSEHDDETRISSLEDKVTDLGEGIAGLQLRFDGLPGEAPLDGRVDDLAGALADLAVAQASQREELLKLVEGVFAILEPLKKLHVAAASAQRLEKFFRPLLATTDEIKSDEVASKAYVDAACVKVSQALREHTRRTLQAMQRALDAPPAKVRSTVGSRGYGPDATRQRGATKTKATAAGKRQRLSISTRRR